MRAFTAGLLAGWAAASLLAHPTHLRDNITRADTLWIELSADVGIAIAWDGREALQQYRALTQAEGSPVAFPPSELFSLSFRIPIDSLWRLRLTAGSTQLLADHTYRQWLEEEYRRGERVVRALLRLHSLPVWVGPEWQPIRSQFRTYLHAAAGIVVWHFLWQEHITTSIPGDPRHGGLYRNQRLLRPSVRVLAGTALSFDAAARGSLLEGIRVEAAYCFLPLRDALLEPVAAQFPGSTLETGRPLPLSGSTLTLCASIALQIPFVLR
ncbi:MAG: hypothetical protein NZ960_07215 [Candidatus Kapabacteria bacterium]|nr:hypothetical protein [Candidatus Kapabacteria bacterium]MDW8013006.1 hypothetical protein [Bacteroidota bacterium]